MSRRTIRFARLMAAAIIFSLSAGSAIPAYAGWEQKGAGWVYSDNGRPLTSCWKQIGASWYHFGADGFMDTGWLTDKGYTYLLRPDGSMVTQTVVMDGGYYSFRPSGELLGGPIPSHIRGLDDSLLREGVCHTDYYWTEVEYCAALVNQERARLGLNALTLSKDLCNIAGYRSAYIESTGLFDHYLNGFPLCRSVATAYFGRDTDVGENLFCNYSTDGYALSIPVHESVGKGFLWYMQSPDHYSNMVNPSYTQIGINVYVNADNTRRYVTQIFR